MATAAVLTDQLRVELEQVPARELQDTLDLIARALPDCEWSPLEQVSRALVCGAWMIRRSPSLRHRHVADWLIASANPLVKSVLVECYRVLDLFGDGSSLGGGLSLGLTDIPSWQPSRFTAEDPTEQFLSEADAAGRTARGVYFTPPVVADYIVRRADQLLKSQLGFPTGLAGALGEGPTVLDPALGAGAFPVAVIRHLAQQQPNWSRFVVQDLLPRLHGVELMLHSLVVAHLNLAAALFDTGFDFAAPLSLPWMLGDSLHQPLKLDVHVILGNPPYSRGSTNRSPWILQLLKENLPHCPSYFQVDGKPLGERKHWLHDDYVKFFRVAQCLLAKQQRALLAFVTNHGYLDNVTFRGMRGSLQTSFSTIEVLDLHGNQKKHRSSGGGDESVFEIAQGTAIGFFCRDSKDSVTTYGELRGSKESKCTALSNHMLARQPIESGPPYYLFVPTSGSSDKLYESAVPITQAFVKSSPAVVTARDRLVTALTRESLQEQLAWFCCADTSEEELRGTLFRRARSGRFPRGDTRGWKMNVARQQLAADDYQSKIVPCSYRPFDERPLLWHTDMIDWPRAPLMETFLSPGNLALVTRRQMVPGQPCNFFWITNRIALDGLIRSDNRGGESIYPLLDAAGADNFSTEFLSSVARAMNAAYCGHHEPRGDEFSGHDLLHFIYAQFNSTEYRQRFQSQLTVDYPRVLLPRSVEIFRRLASLGRSLARTHLGEDPSPFDDSLARPRGQAGLIEPGYPKRNLNTVSVSQTFQFLNIPDSVWEFRVGSHQVCRKWLKDRRGTAITDHFVDEYRDIVARIAKSIEFVAQLDSYLSQVGGLDGV